MDRADCDRKFGAANIARVEKFVISGGEVDFGDHAHIAGEPRGDAVICWLNDGRVAVLGKLFSDNFRDPQTATVEIRFRRRSGQVTNTTTRSINSQGGIVAWRDIEKLSPAGDFQEVRIRLKQFLPDTGIGPGTNLLATRTFKRRRSETVRIHLKILVDPFAATIDEMVDSMREVYASASIEVVVASRENLNLPDLEDVEVGLCAGPFSTEEQRQLFMHRNGVAEHEVVVYFVRDTIPPFSGCATYPAGTPGAVVASGATRWTLAHEVGHVLGLIHVDDNDRLMTGNGTSNITHEPPDFVSSEVQAMFASELT